MPHPPLTTDRLKKWAATKSLTTATTSTGSLLIPFAEVNVSLKQEDTTFRVFAVWRGSPATAADVRALKRTANEINSSRLEPKAYVVPDQKMFVMESVAYIGDGLTDGQLDAFLVTVFSAVLECTGELEKRHPSMVADNKEAK